MTGNPRDARRSLRRILPPLAERIAAGRPVITREQALWLTKHVMGMTSVDHATVTILHTVKSITQFASDRVRSTDDGETLEIGIYSELNDDFGFTYLQTNQLDELALRDLVTRADTITHGMPGARAKIHVYPRDEQDQYAPATLWSQQTAAALQSAREMVVPQLLDTVRSQGRDQQYRSSGMIGVIAKAEAVLTEAGVTAFSDETDCEVTVTARPADGSSTGWSGQAARDWTAIDPIRIATEAVELAARNRHPSAVEPGRRTAILGPGAVVQLMRFFALHFNGGASDNGDTGFSKVPYERKGSRFHEPLFDRRIKVTTDPNDPEGGFRPWFDKGYANHPTTWVDEGRLKYLSYGVSSLAHGKPYAEIPYGFRLHGGEMSLAQMIAQCDEGIYVNRFSSVDILDWHTGLMTGVTRDGCFLVQHGKIARPVKNFRFLTSPFFVLNNIIAIGPAHRAVYGYAPWTEQEKSMTRQYTSFFQWPRRPMVVPPLMVKDFNFNSLIDAV